MTTSVEMLKRSVFVTKLKLDLKLKMKRNLKPVVHHWLALTVPRRIRGGSCQTSGMVRGPWKVP